MTTRLLGIKTYGQEEPTITVGIMDRQRRVSGRLNGYFRGDGFGSMTGGFSAATGEGAVILKDEGGREVTRCPEIVLRGGEGGVFTLYSVTIGIDFHWERREDQVFRGNLILKARDDGTMAIINEVHLEDYLKSVISSEMSGNAPEEFLKAHAVMSRSWLLAALKRKREAPGQGGERRGGMEKGGEIIRWYEQEEHDLYDVCADDHCQRYQGITKIISSAADRAVGSTRGRVVTCGNEICDTRYHKACGGITEEFSSAWEDRSVSCLTSVSDGPVEYGPLITEEDSALWIRSQPQAYCNTRDPELLATILPGFDRETGDFFRWKVEYGQEELAEIIKEKSGMDFGVIKVIKPLRRGPSGRIIRLGITGSRRSMVVGKELEIRRWLSRSHLYSSAFTVGVDRGRSGEAARFIFHGAGWGHGVGLCQIGAAVMATKGFTAEQILERYFTGVETGRLYP